MTGQYILYDVVNEVIKHARTVKLLPDELKWDVGKIEALRITPYDQHVVRAPEVSFQDRPEQPGDKELPKKNNARKLYLKAEDFKKFGFTVGCTRCDHDRRYGAKHPNHTTKGHSEICRQRIIDELIKTPDGQRRIAAADERINRSIAEDVEAQDRAPHGHGGG